MMALGQTTPSTVHAARGLRLEDWFAMDAWRTDALGWAFNLAILRIVFLAFAALPEARHVVTWTARVMPSLPPGVWHPISFYRHIPVGVLTNAGLAHWLAVANAVLIVAALAGAGTRYSLGMATVLSIYLFGLAENQGKVDHYHHLIWFMALLAAGPSGQLLSIDAIARAIRRADRGLVQPGVSSFAALWTLRYAWILMGVLYLVPGLAKLQAALASKWATADNLRHLMWTKWFKLVLYQPHFVLPLRADRLPSGILGAFGWGAILFEVGFITLVLWRSTRWLATAGGIAFHALNGVVLHIPFSSLKFAYVGLVDWAALGRWFAARRQQQPLLVLYDDQCRLCRRTVAALGTLDGWHALEPTALRTDDHRQRHPGVSEDMLIRDLHVIREGQPLRGYDAYVAIAARLPLLWPLALIMRLPAIAAAGRALYRRVADGRRCPIRPQRCGATRAGRERLAAVHVVGMCLVIAQTVVSLANYTAGTRLSFLPRAIRPAVRAGLVDFASGGWVWPFDTYPTFAGIAGSSNAEIWEARVAFASGREERVTAEAYATLCSSSVCSWMSDDVLHERDSVRLRSRSLELVRHLWKYEAGRVGPDAVAVRVYQARYDIDPDGTHVLDQRLMYEFPVAIL